jgi:hypothetical protein
MLQCSKIFVGAARALGRDQWAAVIHIWEIYFGVSSLRTPPRGDALALRYFVTLSSTPDT